MKIYLATWLFESEQGRVLTKIGKRERLLSFYHTTQKQEGFKRYITHGRNQ